MSWLSRSRNGVETPRLLTGFDIVCVYVATNAVLAAGHADDNLVFDNKWRECQRVALGGVGDGGLPQRFSGDGIESDEIAVERRQKQCVVEDG